MKKIHQNWKLQIFGFMVILISVFVSISSGIKYSRLNAAYVLGINSSADTAKAVSTVVYDNGFMQIRSGYELVILAVFLLLAIFIVRQFITILQKLGSDKNFGLGNIVRIAIMNIIIFVLTVVGLASCNIWLIEREAPVDLTYERLTPVIVNITWKSKIPAMSQVLWGYSPEHLDNVSLGASGEQKVLSHEVTLTVAPEQEVYFKVMVNGIKYGETGMQGYYHLGKNTNTDEIYELQLKEASEASSKSN